MHPLIDIPFKPDDRDLRITFLDEWLFKGLQHLKADQPGAWGRMTAQQMVEHLIWIFELSTGQAQVECLVPEERRNQIKPFIFNDQPNPRNFQLPSHQSGLPPQRFRDIASAVGFLRAEVDRFLAQYDRDPEAVHTHPMLGPINSEAWSRLHFKHCYHHLAQFAVLG